MSEYYDRADSPKPELHELFHTLDVEGQKTSDPVRALLSEEVKNQLHYESPLQDHVRYAMLLRSEYGPSEKVNLIQSAFLYVNDLEGHDFPTNAIEVTDVVMRVAEICDEHSRNDTHLEGNPLYEEFCDALYFKQLQTTMASRYTIAELVLQTAKERFPGGATVLDVGPSVMHGLKAMALPDDYAAFPPPKIYDDLDKIDHNLTRKMRSKLHKTPVLREGWGADIENVQDPRVQLWARANLRPAERTNPLFMQSYEALAAARPANIHTARLDFTNETDIDRYMAERGGAKHDLVICNTVLYQMARSDLEVALNAIPKVLEHRGIALVQDSLTITGQGITDIEITPKGWDNWTSALFDMQRPDAGWQEIATSPNSRFDKMRFGIGKLAVNGSALTPAEWLQLP